MTNNNQLQTTVAIKTAVIKTMVFFDMFNYPLTSWELWQNLKVATDFLTLKTELDNLVEEKIIFQRNGYYFLLGREGLITIRRERYNYTNYKIKLAKEAVRLFKWLPSVKLVTVSNLIGHHNLREESDIDIFIISSAKRLWLTRLFCTGLMKITRKRPTNSGKQDKMCLSFYASLEGLDMTALRFKPDDPYFDYWFLGLFSIYDQDKYLAYLRFRNPWLKKLFPNNLLFKDNFLDNYVQSNKKPKSFLIIGDFFNSLARKIQMAIMPQTLKDLATKNSGVILSESILRFYLNDRREEFRQKYYDKLTLFNIYE